MNAAQCRMARAALEIDIRKLAEMADVSKGTIERLEKGETLKPATVEKVQTCLEKAGVEFVPENGGGPGVRLRKPTKKRGRQRAAP
jgi:transcriptional regulator with XRE-family HTH domain